MGRDYGGHGYQETELSYLFWKLVMEDLLQTIKENEFYKKFTLGKYSSNVNKIRLFFRPEKLLVFDLYVSLLRHS